MARAMTCFQRKLKCALVVNRISQLSVSGRENPSVGPRRRLLQILPWELQELIEQLAKQTAQTLISAAFAVLNLKFARNFEFPEFARNV